MCAVSLCFPRSPDADHNFIFLFFYFFCVSSFIEKTTVPYESSLLRINQRHHSFFFWRKWFILRMNQRYPQSRHTPFFHAPHSAPKVLRERDQRGSRVAAPAVQLLHAYGGALCLCCTRWPQHGRGTVPPPKAQAQGPCCRVTGPTRRLARHVAKSVDNPLL